MTISDPKKFVPQREIEPGPLTIPASIILLDYWDTWSLSHSPLQGESNCPACNEKLGDNTLATKRNGGSKWPLAIQKNSVPQWGVEPQPLTNLGEHHTTRLLRHLITVTSGSIKLHIIDFFSYWLMLIFHFHQHFENQRSKVWGGLSNLKIFHTIDMYEMTAIFQFFHNGWHWYSVIHWHSEKPETPTLRESVIWNLFPISWFYEMAAIL